MATITNKDGTGDGRLRLSIRVRQTVGAARCSVDAFTLINPWFRSDFDARASRTARSMCSSSPGRTGRGERKSSIRRRRCRRRA